MDEASAGTVLLGAIRRVFGESEQITTEDLLAAINDDDELPFGGWKGGWKDGKRGSTVAPSREC